MIHDHPPLIVYDVDKAAYYDALAAYDNTEDLAPMTVFLRQQAEKTWGKTLDRELRRKGMSENIFVKVLKRQSR